MASYSYNTNYLNERHALNAGQSWQAPTSAGTRTQVIGSVFTQRPEPVQFLQDPGQYREPVKPQGYFTAQLPLTQKALTLVGLAVLACLAALPVSDAGLLWHDFNYVFWMGQGLPIAVILSLVALLVVYFIWSVSIGPQGVENMTIHELVTLVSTFICMLGVILVLSSLALYWNGYQVTSALSYSCKGSAVTRDTRQYYMNLLALRKGPECAAKFSVAECSGFPNAAPPAYSDYLLALESNFYCSGFCYTTGASLAQTNSSLPEVADKPASGFLEKEQTNVLAQEASKRLHRELTLPPALFTQNPYKTSCDGAASRNLQFLALRISQVWWAIGCAMIGLSALVGFGEFFFCARKKYQVS